MDKELMYIFREMEQSFVKSVEFYKEITRNLDNDSMFVDFMKCSVQSLFIENTDKLINLALKD